jgi:hypothetical protein
LEDKRSNNEEHKKKLTGMFPILFCCAFLIIACVTVVTATSKNPSKKVGLDSSTETMEEDTAEEDKPVLTVLKEVNDIDKTMTLLNPQNGEEIILTYSGGTEIYDKYKQVIAASQLTIGEIVEASYSEQQAKLNKLQISSKAWEYQGVNNWTMDLTMKVFTIAESKYQYSKNLVVVNQGQLSDILGLNNKDELTVKGYDREIWSILVTKGHGIIQFEDYKDFVGGTAYIGNDQILPVTSDMSVEVQEGSYDVTLEKESLTGTKHVVVEANQDVTVNMGEFKMPVKKTGLVNFSITPKGADLYIDDQLVSYEKAVKLEYGQHSIKVALGGYSTYAGDIEVGSASQTLSIGLVEAQDSSDTNSSDKEDTDNSTDGSGNNSKNGNGSSSGTDGNADQSIEDKNETDDTKTAEKTNQYVLILEPVGASVYFEGADYKGEVPVTFPKIVGTYHITLIKSGYVTETHTVEFKDDGKSVTLRYDNMVKME